MRNKKLLSFVVQKYVDYYGRCQNVNSNDRILSMTIRCGSKVYNIGGGGVQMMDREGLYNRGHKWDIS
jgi:hypothetical protein